MEASRFNLQTDKELDREKRHPIRVVAHRTGLTQEVLRAWEIRYKAVIPERSGGGQRLYLDADIERLNLIRKVLKGGRRIGQVAGLSTDELKSLVAEDRESTLRLVRASDSAPLKSRPQSYLQRCLEAVIDLDDKKLETTLRRAALSLDGSDLIDQVLTPMLIEIGNMWRLENLSPGHERLAITVIRRLLDEQRHSLANSEGPRIVVATPSGQHHEIGALLAAVKAAAEGWQVLYLGPNLPATSISEAALSTGAKAVALSLIYPSDDPKLPHELKNLRENLPDSVMIIVGGQAAGAYRPVLSAIGALWLPNAPALRLALELVQATQGKGDHAQRGRSFPDHPWQQGR